MDFGEAEAKFAELQGKLRRKAISQETFYQEVARLMVQDADGRYWAVDPAGNGWLYHDGQSWLPAMPPTVHTQVNKIVPHRRGRWPVVLGVIVLALLCLLSVLAVLTLRSSQRPGLIVPVGPSAVRPKQTLQIEFTNNLETPSPETPTGTPPFRASSSGVAPIVVPTTTGGCRYDAEFVGDVSIPEGQPVTPSQRFNKIWRVRNTGSCPWVGFAWTFITGDHLGGPDSVVVQQTEPGATVDISVPLYAEAEPGTYTGIWRLRDPQSRDVGPTVRVKVVVVPVSPTP